MWREGRREAMTIQEIKKAIKETKKALKSAAGCDYIRLNEELETLLFLLISKRG